jgi:protein-S-isoprenylcysteine O-methyltransferase Ste14
MSSILLSHPTAEGEVMGDRHHDPTDHFRTTQPHAGITMKDNLFWPGFILLIVALSGVISTLAAAAYRHYEWLATTGLIAVLGTVAGALWFVVERRRVTRIDEQWHVADAHSPRRQRAAR